jgi:histidyl-tRNA synthetase
LKKNFKTVKGMRDYLKEDKWKLDFINNQVKNLFLIYSYDEVSTPIVESFELLSEKAGDEIRDKMYVFKDKAERILALRPEMTVPIARLYINSLMKSAPKPVRLGYIGTCYRYDNPQMGRYREFWQSGFELFGSDNPESDVEIIMIAYDLMRKLGFDNFKIRIGDIGILRSYLSYLKIEDKIQDKIMGLLDLKMKSEIEEIFKVKMIPENEKKIFYDFLEIKGKDLNKSINILKALFKNYEQVEESINKFIRIIKVLSKLYLKNNLEIDMSLARGLEYYTGIIFEIFVDELKIALGGGGRYDKLIEVFGGDSTPAVGFAAGTDRLILAMEKMNLFKKPLDKKILMVTLTPDQISYGLNVTSKLRQMGIPIEFDVLGRNLKRAVKFAIENDYEYLILIGSNEEETETLTIKNITTEEQNTIKIDKINKILIG